MNCWRTMEMLPGQLSFPLEEWMGWRWAVWEGAPFPRPLPALLLVFSGSSPWSLSHTYFSLFLFLSVSPLFSLSSFLCLCHRLYYLVSFISMALISMESKYSNKHIRLNIGLCRKWRNVSCLLPALWRDSRWMKWRAGGRCSHPWALQRALEENEYSAWASDAKVLLFWQFWSFSTSSLSFPSKREFSKLCWVREILVSLVSMKAYTKAKASISILMWIISNLNDVKYLS